MKNIDKLAPRQKQFCIEYQKDLNATQAAIRAGYSEKTARQQAHDLLQKPEIKKEVNKYKNKIAERAKLDATYVLENLKSIVDKCQNSNNLFFSSSAVNALNLLGKHLSLFTDKKEIIINGNIADLIKKARERSNLDVS